MHIYFGKMKQIFGKTDLANIIEQSNINEMGMTATTHFLWEKNIII